MNQGDAVNRNGHNGIISDIWVKKSGQFKGKLGVTFVGNRYGEEFVAPEELSAGWVL